MDISTLNTQNLSRYAGAEFTCTCGALHAVSTQSIVFGAAALASLQAFIAPFAPDLGVITVVSDAQVRDKTNRTVEKNLSRLGYRVHAHTLEVGVSAILQNALDIAVAVPEESFLILGIGGGAVADLVKYAAAAKKRPCVFVATSPALLGILTPSAMLKTADNVEETFKTPPFSAVLCDTELLADLPPGLIPSAFGELLSKAVSLFDYKCAHLIAGERFCPHLYELGLAAVDETAAHLRDSALSEKDAAARLAESSLRFSALAQLTGNSRLLSGGEVQSSHALSLLFAREERLQKQRGETEFLLSRIVLEIYKSFLASPPAFFASPPSNLIRAAKIAEYLGIPESIAQQKIRAVPESETLKLRVYRIGEYRDELYSDACAHALRLGRAWKIFKRLYPDDGFSLLNHIDPPDAALALALAPDLKEKFTLLSHLKDAGLLEEHLT